VVTRVLPRQPCLGPPLSSSAAPCSTFSKAKPAYACFDTSSPRCNGSKVAAATEIFTIKGGSCVLEVSVGMHAVDALADSGSTTTICSERVYRAAEHSGRATDLDTSINHVLVSCTDDRMSAMGSTVLTITLEDGTDFNVPCLVVKDFMYPLLLGIDFLLRERACSIPVINRMVFFSSDTASRLRLLLRGSRSLRAL
jgi:hypothetical protein